MRVLFVCIGNACRSQMAEAFARELAPDVIEPASCGLAPVQMMAPITRELMREIGIDVDRQEPKGFDATGADYDLIVNMSGLPLPRGVTAPVREWKVEDPYWADRNRHRKVRDHIAALVNDLATELRRKAKTGDQLR